MLVMLIKTLDNYKIEWYEYEDGTLVIPYYGIHIDPDTSDEDIQSLIEYIRECEVDND